MKNLKYLMDHILYQIFKVILKKHREKIKENGEKNNPLIKICANEIKKQWYLKLKQDIISNFLIPETIKLLGSTKDEITKDENCENVPNLEITEIVIIHCNIVNNYQQNSQFLYTPFPNKLFCQLLDILSKNFIFLKTFNSEIPFWSKVYWSNF